MVDEERFLVDGVIAAAYALYLASSLVVVLVLGGDGGLVGHASMRVVVVCGVMFLGIVHWI